MCTGIALPLSELPAALLRAFLKWRVKVVACREGVTDFERSLRGGFGKRKSFARRGFAENRIPRVKIGDADMRQSVIRVESDRLAKRFDRL